MPDRPISDDGADDVELRELRALGARLAPSQERWEHAPESLWDRIDAEVGSSRPAAGDAEVTEPEAARRRAPRGGDASGGRRGASMAPWILGAAAALLLVAAVGWFLRDDSGSEVVAATTLDQLGDSGQGTAELLDSDGSLQLRVEVEDLDAGDGFVEVWVIDTEVSRLVSLGPLRSDGLYDLPDGLDPAAFPVVDLSYEPFDGDPAHSGDSVLRGTLEL